MFELNEPRYDGRSNGTSRVLERSDGSSTVYNYQLLDRALWRAKLTTPALTVATRRAGSIIASIVENQFATGVSMEGGESPYWCFLTQLRGRAALISRGEETLATEHRGLVLRPAPGTRLRVSDDAARWNLFLDAAELVRALEHALDRSLSAPLQFRPDLEWNNGLASSLKGQLEFVGREFQRADGITSSPVALASATDLLLGLVLRGARHNYTDQLGRETGGAVPFYVRRAEEFMHAHCDQPLRMAQIATAAGCSIRSLELVFRTFRGTTPLAALHAIRLEQARRTIVQAGPDARVGAIARRYGFTNPGRFSAAFLRRFEELPSATVRRVGIGD